MDALDTFTCNKYHCTLTRKACADRQAALIERAGYRRVPMYPGCQECSQGAAETDGITSDRKPHLWGRFMNTKIQEGKGMAFTSKINDDILRKRTAEGKNPNEIAKEFGCTPGAVLLKTKALGLTPNYLRRRKSKDAGTAASVRQLEKFNVQKPKLSSEPAEAQIIPVTLRLNVEVHVRVSTEGVNAA